jgi:ornithine cyclodeaminase/alanine dehydrogenase-like protein (mu-crystallin family)
MPLVIGADAVHAALPWTALANALHAAFVAPVHSAPVAPTRHAHILDAEANEHLLLMPAWNAAYIGVKQVTVLPNAAQYGGRTVEASYLLCDRHTGAPRALMDGEALTLRRTAAVSALAAQHLARAESRTLLLVGSGRLAPWMARAHVALRPTIECVLVWGRSPDRAASIAQMLAAEGISAQPCDDLQDAVQTADLISCATTSHAALLKGAWLVPGTHVDLVGAYTSQMRETDDEVMRRSRLFVDDRRSALAEAGDLLQAMATGAVSADHVRGDLRELLSGEVPGRTASDDITCFKSVGLALEDLVAATLVADTLVADTLVADTLVADTLVS